MMFEKDFPAWHNPYWSGRPSSSWGCWLVPIIALFSGQFLSSCILFVCFIHWITLIFTLDRILGLELNCRLKGWFDTIWWLLPMDDDCCLLPRPNCMRVAKVEVLEGWTIIPMVAAKNSSCVSILNSWVSIHGVKLEEFWVWIDSAINWRRNPFQSIHKACVLIHL